MTPEDLTAIEQRVKSVPTRPLTLSEIHANCALELLGSAAYQPSSAAKDLGAEVFRLRDLVSAIWVDAETLLAEVKRLQDLLITRGMQLSTVKELLAQSEAKCDELRARWDRAETAREDLEKLLKQTRGIATKRVELVRAEHRYSTEAVDALLSALDSLETSADGPGLRELEIASTHVRASREPAR